MNLINLQDYINNPCLTSSLPYWKTKSISVPADMLIVHDELYQAGNYDGYVDEFEALFRNKPVEWITTVAADSILELAENRKDFAMSDEDFSAFAKYHFPFAKNSKVRV